jgi:hypothetical protein
VVQWLLNRLLVSLAVPAKHDILIAHQIVYAFSFCGQHTDSLTGFIGSKLFAIGESDGPDNPTPAIPEFAADYIGPAVAIEVVFDAVFVLRPLENGRTHFQDALHVLSPHLLHLRALASLKDKPPRDFHRRIGIYTFIIGDDDDTPSIFPFLDDRVYPRVSEIITDLEAIAAKSGNKEQAIRAAVSTTAVDAFHKGVGQTIAIPIPLVYYREASFLRLIDQRVAFAANCCS